MTLRRRCCNALQATGERKLRREGHDPSITNRPRRIEVESHNATTSRPIEDRTHVSNSGVEVDNHLTDTAINSSQLPAAFDSNEADPSFSTAEMRSATSNGIDSQQRRQGMTVAVVGCGYWGSKHVRVLHSTDGVDQIIAVDRDTATAAQLKNRYPSIRTSSDVELALANADAAVIATPPRTHRPIAELALKAGCHVLVEKPLATSTKAAEALVKQADNAGLTLMSGHTFEHNPAVWKLRDLVSAGELGDVYHINTSRLNLGLFQGDVNVLWDLAPHDISILNFVLDSRPTSVTAWAGAHAHHPVEDVAYLRLHYSEPSLCAQIHVSWLDPCKTRRITVVGSNKMAVYDDIAVDERIKVFDKGLATHPSQTGEGSAAVSSRPAAYRLGGVESPYVDGREPLLLEIEAFIRSVRTGTPPPSDGRSGLAVVQVLEAADRSITTGTPVKVDYSPLLTNAEPAASRPPTTESGLHAAVTLDATDTELDWSLT